MAIRGRAGIRRRSGLLAAEISAFGATGSGSANNPDFTGTLSASMPGMIAVGSGASDSEPAPEDRTWGGITQGPGVVWFHDFRFPAEVDQFRFTQGYSGGNDPLAVGSANAPLCRRIVTDGVNGRPCLEIVRAAGTAETSHWWRPFSPIVGTGNGRGVHDPAANSTLVPQSYAPSDGSSTIYNWGRRGYYGHSSYHTGSEFDGTEFYLQMRVKMDPRRTDDSNTQIGKLMWISTTRNTNIAQQLVPYSGAYHTPASHGDPNYFRIFGGGDTDPLEQNDSVSNGNQPGSDLGVCNISTGANCWYWSGGWDTVMFHIVPGREDVSESLIEVYVCHEGESEYTRIWNQTWPNGYSSDSNIARGYNAVILSTYQNGLSQGQEFFHRFADVVFSREFIPAPSDEPDWLAGMTVGTWYEISGDSPDLGLEATNNADDIDPDPSGSAPYDGSAGFDGIWDAWNSAIYVPTLGPRGSLVLYGGGHGDYWGNCIVRFDLATRTWSLHTNPSTAGPFDGSPLDNGAYTDGTPSPPHTYYFLQYDPTHNALLCLKAIAAVGAPFSGASASLAIPWSFSFDTDEWSSGTNNTSNLGSESDGGCCYDPVRDVFWTMDHGAGDFARYNARTDTWTTFSASGSYNSGSAIAIDPVTDYMLIFDFDAGVVYRKDPDNMTASRSTVSISGTVTWSAQSSVEYCRKLGGFIYHRAGTGNVYLITTSNDWANGTVTLLTSNTNSKSFLQGNGTARMFGKSRTLEFGNKIVQLYSRAETAPVLAMRLA